MFVNGSVAEITEIREPLAVNGNTVLNMLVEDKEGFVFEIAYWDNTHARSAHEILKVGDRVVVSGGKVRVRRKTSATGAERLYVEVATGELGLSLRCL